MLIILPVFISFVACSVVGWFYVSLRKENKRLKEQIYNLAELFKLKGTSEQKKAFMAELEKERQLKEKRQQFRYQNRIIGIGIVIIVLMLLFPPWRYYRSGRSGGMAGYGFIAVPKYRVSTMYPYYIKDNASDVFINVSLLSLQCVMVALVAGGLVYLGRKPTI